MSRRIVDLPEMGQAQAVRLPVRDQVERVLPELELDVRRRRRGNYEVARRNGDRRSVPDEGLDGRRMGVAEEGRGLARRVRYLEAEHLLAAAQRVKVAFGHRCDLSPEPIHLV